MHQNALLLPVAPSRPRRLWLALLLSIGLHGLLTSALWMLPTSCPGPTGKGPLAEIPVVIVSGEDVSISPAAEPPSSPAHVSSAEKDPGPIVVQPLAVNSGAQAAG